MARMLMIEDDPQNRELMACLVPTRGHSIMAAETGVRGLETTRLEAQVLLDEIASCPGAGV